MAKSQSYTGDSRIMDCLFHRVWLGIDVLTAYAAIGPVFSSSKANAVLATRSVYWWITKDTVGHLIIKITTRP